MSDAARWYEIEGKRYVSVTTVLSVIAKPGLGPWYARKEREYFEAAMKQALRAKRLKRDALLDRVQSLVRGAKAADRARDLAAARGTSIHAAIADYLQGRKVSLEPEHKAAFDSWRQWWRAARFEPLQVEQVVWSPRHGYAGTLDLYAVAPGGRLVVLDWKITTSVYPEHYLQNIAYREAAVESRGWQSHQGLIVRIPRDGAPVRVSGIPVEVTLKDFLAVLHLWRWWRRAQALPAE